jgi:hypothetical protein
MAMEHLKGFILILVVLWLVWFFFGGASKKNEEGIFVEPATQTQTK